ncbi:TPA: trehalose operon repressor [Staphylococcus argenteus]|uniref:trehalose operon repressor n=1 Tax=Staphylococcus argenteus TaxID=985002 RepID=UPI00050376BF|nr:trehalose operon repressor [Staphylococcus argenteus]MBE2136960.1 trehalose operon repressor [Staphylococcus argenteus]MDT3006399.1 trehalose operon repressor [Staphylococcus argenteus]UPO21248.1 trehalose operon repressor [Staphylococcus argenteus]CDR65090.1 GntR family transcriptional regulator [Staphylococcus argenteus]HDY9445800.1 trehalose operon repressor [Staphylococcus argenteus]
MMKQKKFIKIYEALKVDILNGKVQYGEQIPSEHELVKLYSSSRETVRKALDLLALDGMIQKIHGKGSLVIYQEMTEFPFSELVSFKEMQEEMGVSYSTEVVVNEMVDACDVPEVQRALNIDSSEQLIHIVRTRRLNQHVKIVDEDYFLKTFVSSISNEVASNSIYDYLENELGLNISYSSKSITFEPFDEQAYQLFGDVSIPFSATVRSVVYLENTSPFQYNISKHLANEFKFNDFSRRRSK